MNALNSFRNLARGGLFFLAMIFAGSAVFRLVDGVGRAVAADATTKGANNSVDLSLSSNGTQLGPSSDTAFTTVGKNRTQEADADVKAIADLLQNLKAREASLASKERGLNLRTEQIKEAESLINENLQLLEQAEASLQKTLALADGAMERDISQLTKVYETMKAKDAAILFEAMDPNFAAGFLARMKPIAAAGVMAGLSPDKSYSISIILAGRNREVPVK